MKNIRNFCIIAHIDHGKSTLADRLLQSTGTISDRDMMDQVLDDMDLEREKGITIKSHAIQINYKHKDGQEYILNLVGTRGHVDFSYEVSRALAACEGALLLVDATQGIQAQTISNLYLAIENNLEIIPVINKIDMEGAMIPEVTDQIVELIGCKAEDILLASGKSGIGIEEILTAIIDRYRVFNGTLRKNAKIKFNNTGLEYGADEVGILKLGMEAKEEVCAGDVGYIITGIKNAKDGKVG